MDALKSPVKYTVSKLVNVVNWVDRPDGTPQLRGSGPAAGLTDISRRDFLKLFFGGLITGSASYVLAPYLKGTDEFRQVEDKTNSIDSLPTLSEITEAEKTTKLGHRIQKLGAAILVINAGTEPDLEKNLRDTYGLNEVLTDSLPLDVALHVIDTGIVAEVLGSSGKSINLNSNNGSVGLVDLLIKGQFSDLKQVVENNNLQADLIRLGSDGVATLKRIGINIDDTELHRQLIDPYVVKQIDGGLYGSSQSKIVDSKHRSDNSIIILGEGKDELVFQFDRSSS